MKRLISRFGIVPVTFSLGLLVGGTLMGGVALAEQTHMHSALSSLQSAQYQLGAATHNHGGHRASALNYVNLAIEQVRDGIRYANE